MPIQAVAERNLQLHMFSMVCSCSCASARVVLSMTISEGAQLQILFCQRPSAWMGLVDTHARHVTQVRWRRIILDEAHSIKDRRCNTAQAVFALQAK
jgi:hypothetical protein